MAPLRILIADDNTDAAVIMAMLLGKLGHEVRVAHNGAVALEAGGLMAPQVVLLDLGMPVMDGYTACQRMRETQWGKQAFIVALTGWGQEEDRRKTKEAGFDKHLVKPIGTATLSEVLVEASQVVAG